MKELIIWTEKAADHYEGVAKKTGRKYLLIYSRLVWSKCWKLYPIGVGYPGFMFGAPSLEGMKMRAEEHERNIK